MTLGKKKPVTSNAVIDGYRRVLAFVYAIAVHEENISDSKIILQPLSRIFLGIRMTETSFAFQTSHRYMAL